MKREPNPIASFALLNAAPLLLCSLQLSRERGKVKIEKQPSQAVPLDLGQHINSQNNNQYKSVCKKNESQNFPYLPADASSTRGRESTPIGTK